ncbi:MAG: M15 family metallopeptidase [Clostridia bacterium]|nr:M15 family metallopeptidase [Clostridia bacterium]
MNIPLNEEKTLVITPLQIQRTVFALLSVVMAAVVCKRSLPQGKAAIARLDGELQRLTFRPAAVTLYVGETFDSLPECSPPSSRLDKDAYTWELLDDGVLTVENGHIVAAKNGTTTLTASARHLTASVGVTVQYRELPPDSTLPRLYYEKLPIANYQNTLEADDVPADLMAIPAEYVAENYGTLYISAETFEAYQALLRAMQSEVSGCRMHIISAYRSYARQSQLYDNAVQRYINAGNSSTQARLLALNTTQTPGNSEHQLGCSIDVSNDNTTDHNYQNTPEGQWLAENAHKFGFVLRYPADKEEITRIAYEPWHIRYVGVFHATYMYVNHVCLEEYVSLQEEAEAAAYAYTANK